MRASRGSGVDAALVMALTTVVLWALNIPVVKLGLDGWNPLAFSLLRFGSAALIYVVWVLATERSLRIRLSHLPLFAIAATIGVALNQAAFMYGLQKSSASTVTLVFATTPLWSALLARALGWEFVKPLFWVAVAVSAGGVALVLVGTGAAVSSSSLQGALIAFGAPITWGFYSVLIKPLLRHYSPLHVSAIMMLIGAPEIALLGAPQVAAQDWGRLTASSWVALVYALVFSLILANLLWFVAIRKAGAARAVALMPLQPFLGVLFSALLLSERLDWREAVGGVIIIAAVTLAVRSVVPVDDEHDVRATAGPD